MYNDCQYERFKIAKMIEVRSFANNTSGMSDLLDVMDYMDKKLDEFKVTYLKLKQRKALLVAE